MQAERRTVMLGLAMAALPVLSGPAGAQTDAAGLPASALLQAWLSEEGGATERFWARVAARGTPLLEVLADGRRLRVSFVWRGAKTREVQIFWALRRHDREPFTRFADSDLWHYSLVMPLDTHVSYQLAPDVPRLPGADRQSQRQAIRAVVQADPLNPRRWVPGRAGDARAIESLLLGPQAPALPDARPVPLAQRGSLRHFDWHSQRLDNTRSVSLYLPAGQAPAGGWPLLLLFDRESWLERVPTPALLERGVAEGRFAPMAVLFVGHPTPELRGHELPCNAAFADAMALELLPHARGLAALSQEAQQVVVAGASYGGLAAAFLGLRHPQVFGKVLSLSGSFWWSPEVGAAGPSAPLEAGQETEWLTQQFAQAPLGSVSYVLSAGLFERTMANDGPGILETNRHLRDVLRARGQRVLHREFAGGHDYLAWHIELLQGLMHHLPVAKEKQA